MTRKDYYNLPKEERAVVINELLIKAKQQEEEKRKKIEKALEKKSIAERVAENREKQEKVPRMTKAREKSNVILQIEKIFKDKGFKNKFLTNTEIGVVFKDLHFVVKVTKKKERFTEFVVKPAKTITVKKLELIEVIQDEIDFDNIFHKGEIHLRLADSDYAVKITQKSSKIDGL